MGSVDWRMVDGLVLEITKYGNEGPILEYIRELHFELEALRKINAERIQEEIEADAQ